MPGPWAKETELCADGAHDRCPHRSGRDSQLNMLTLKVESGVGLCPCSCHSPCPAATSGRPRPVPMKTWYESCTCPGAEQEQCRPDQDSLGLRDFNEMREDSRRRSGARREAFQAAQARAAGKGHPQEPPDLPGAPKYLQAE